MTEKKLTAGELSELGSHIRMGNCDSGSSQVDAWLLRMLDEYEELRAECTRLALLQKGTDAEQWKRQALDVGGERNALHTRLSEVEGERDKYAKLHASALGSLMLAETVLSVIAGKACACSKLAAAAIGQLDFDASSIDAALKVG